MASRKKNGGETAENMEKETQTVEVPAEDVTAVKEDGTETPLTEMVIRRGDPCGRPQRLPLSGELAREA